MILYVNDIKIDLEPERPIAVNKQVNVIGDLNTRQSDYSQKIKAPKTSNNKRALQGLSNLGNVSQIPYQNNTAKLFDNNGTPIIGNGYAVVKETGATYEIVVYEGITELFKKVENTSLKDIGLPALNHLKNVPAIVDTWDENREYVYLLADYNGKFFASTSNVNADYLVPSAYVKYIWQRVFEYAGYTFDGSVFDTDRFQNLTLTYPKPVGSDDQDLIEIYDHTFNTQSVNPFFPDPNSGGYLTFYFPYLLQQSISTAYLISEGNYNEVIEIQQDGLYRFKLQGRLNFPIDEEANYRVYYWLNDPLEQFDLLTGIDATTEIDLSFNLTLSAGDKISLNFGNGEGFVTPVLNFGSDLDINIFFVEGDNVDFEEAFIDFKTTDFLKEVMFQFGLTPFLNTLLKSCLFLTEKERYQDAEVVDWSDKFIDTEKEVYQLGYAQRNDFRYKYNDQEQTHYDGYISIGNPNLAEQKTVIQSRTYAPERQTRLFANKKLDVCKIWDKEVNDDGDVTYKDLDKRFYFLEVFDFGQTINLESEVYNELDEAITNAKWGRFLNNNFQRVISENYSATKTILNNTELRTAFIWLKPTEINTLDLTKQYFFKQLGASYVINKVINFVPGVQTKVELLKVNTKEIYQQENLPPPLFLEITDDSLVDCELTLTVNTNIPQPFVVSVRAENVLPGVPDSVITIFGTVDNDEITISLDTLPNGFYKFSLVYGAFLASNQTDALEVECGFIPPPPEFINLLSLETISIVGNTRTVKVTFETSIDLPDTFQVDATSLLTGELVSTNVTASIESFNITLQHQTPPPIQIVHFWRVIMRKGTTASNAMDSTG